MKKYDFTGEKKTLRNGKTVSRIRAVRDIHRFSVKSGDLGGWLEFSENLEETGDCWVADEAIVTGGGTVVRGNAYVSNEAMVSSDFTTYSIIGDAAFVSGKAQVHDTSLTGMGISIKDNAKLTACSLYGNDIIVSKNATLTNVTVMDSAEYIRVTGNASIKGGDYGTTIIGKNIKMKDNARFHEVHRIDGSDITAVEDCYAGDGVTFLGDSVSLLGASSLKGHIYVGKRIHLSECACIFNDSPKWVSIDSVELSGDVNVDAFSL